MFNKEKFKTARTKANKSHKEIAEHLGVSEGSISHWENGRRFPKMATAKKVAKFLGVEIYELLNGATIDKGENKDYSDYYEVPVYCMKLSELYNYNIFAGDISSFFKARHAEEMSWSPTLGLDCFTAKLDTNEFLPHFYEGMILEVLSSREPENGDIVIAKIREEKKKWFLDFIFDQEQLYQ